MEPIDINDVEEEVMSVEDFMVEFFTERERKEIQFALLYAHEFDHGTDGHHRLKLIAKLFITLVEQLAMRQNSVDQGIVSNDVMTEEEKELLCRTSVLSA